MNGRSRTLLTSILLCALHEDMAQCSITLGNDTTICQGQNATLLGPPGYPTYNWSNGAGTQNITVGAAGNYTCTVSYPTGNIVTNGNFSAGNTGFTNQFNLALNMQPEPTYNVGANANWYHPQWQGTGNGNFLIINAGWMHSGWNAWCQTIPVCPNQTYTLVVRAMSVATQGAPMLDWAINGVQQNFGMQTAAAQGSWTLFTNTWTSGPGQFSADFCIRVASSWGIGNDFAIDDISISSTIVLSDQQQVFVTPLPVVYLGLDQLACTGDLLTLNATTPGATYLWQDGSTNPTFNVTGAGIYDVDVTVNGCTATDAIQFWYNPYPALDLGNDTTLCAGQTLPMNIFTPGATYQWQNGSAAPSFTATGPGTYDVDLTLNGCTSHDTIAVSYNPLPVVFLGNDTTVCAGDQVLLDATTPGATYVWQDNSTAATFNVTGPGTYDVDVTVNGCSANDAQSVTYNPLPAFDLGNDTTVCPGEAVTWDATVPGATYLWNNSSTSSTLTTASVGTSSVTVTLNGCSATDAATLSNFSLQTVNLGPDVIACAGSPTAIGVSVPGASYLWNTGQSTDSISVGATGTYWVEATLNGCAVRDSVDVSFTPLPLVDLGPDTSLCDGTLIWLDAVLPNATYLWNDGSTGGTLNAGAGTWSVQVTANGCINSDTIGIGWFVPPFIDLGADTTLCPGQTTLLDASYPGAAYLWQDGTANSTITASSPGNYSVQVTDIYGCSYTDDIDVTFANPQAIDLGNDTTICDGAQLTLDATTPGASYLWSTGATSPSITVSAANNYSVVVTQGQCTVSDAVNVLVVPNPNVILPNDTTLCAGETLLLNATTPNVTYVWQNGSSAATFLVGTAGNYNVTVTNAAGCTDSDAITVNYAIAGSIDLGNDTSFCAGGSILLDATLAGSTYTWSTGATSATITANASGTYWIEALQGNCSVTDTIVVTLNSNPSVTLPNDTTLCAGETLLLNATTPNVTYAWQNGSTSATFLVSMAGNYNVTITNAAGCTDSDAFTVNYAIAGSIDLGTDTSFCAGGSILLDATLAGSTYTWSTGATSATITANVSGTYWVEALQGNCSITDTIIVTVNANPNVTLPGDTTLCTGSTLLLDATTSSVTYAWQNGSTAATFLVNTSGNYGVTVTDGNGCADSDGLVVNYFTPGAVDLGADTAICPSGSLLLSASLPGADYLWSTGATTSSITVSTAGDYWLQAGAPGCMSSDTIGVAVVQLLQPDLGADVTACFGDTVQLSVITGGASVLWSDGTTGIATSATSTGTVSVQLNMDDCTSYDEVDVEFIPFIDSLNIGPDVAHCPGDPLQLAAPISGVAYDWSTGQVSPTITITEPGIYWVEVTGSCVNAIDTIVITPGDCGLFVHVPNTFTPDGDGTNESFAAVVTGEFIEYVFTVFDRWGEPIWNTNDTGSSWNGEYGGTQAPDGVYTWTIHYKAVTPAGIKQERLIGHVTLLR